MSRTPALGPLVHESLAARAYSALRLALLRRDFEPGEQIDPARLSQQMGISQTPLKEAIRRLAEEGLLEVRPRSGSYVTGITRERLDEALEARMLLERWAVTAAGERAEPSRWDRLDALVTESEARLASHADAILAEDQFTILDQEFHTELVAAGGNSSLRRLYESIGMHVMLARAWCLEPAGELDKRMKEGVREHKRIVRALRAGDTALALREVERHVLRSHKRAIAVIDSNGGVI